MPRHLTTLTAFAISPHYTLTPQVASPCLCLEALALPVRSLPGPRGPRAPSLLRWPPSPPQRSLIAAQFAPAIRHWRTVATEPDSLILLLSCRLRRRILPRRVPAVAVAAVQSAGLEPHPLLYRPMISLLAWLHYGNILHPSP